MIRTIIFIIISLLFFNNLFSKDIYKFYENEIIAQKNNITDNLDKLYLNGEDENTISYINSLNLNKYEKSDFYFYYAYLLGEKCFDEKCKLRLKQFYNKIYNLTGDIEIYGNILFFDTIFNKKELDEILEFLRKNNSIEALNYKNLRDGITLNLENIENNKFKKITLNNSDYYILLEKLYNEQKIKILLKDNSTELYIYIENLGEKSLRFIGKFSILNAITLKFLDLNNDEKKEIIIENTSSYVDNEISIFTIKNHKLYEFQTKNIDFSKYYKLFKGKKELKKEISDDFGNKNLFYYMLPNREEYYSSNIEKNKLRTFFIINGKMYMRIKNTANFEIILNSELKGKLKLIKPENNFLNLSTSF